jgi:hypothetical protein
VKEILEFRSRLQGLHTKGRIGKQAVNQLQRELALKNQLLLAAQKTRYQAVSVSSLKPPRIPYFSKRRDLLHLIWTFLT